MAGQSPPVLTSLTIRSIGQVERVEVAEIDWIQAAGNYGSDSILMKFGIPLDWVFHRDQHDALRLTTLNVRRCRHGHQGHHRR